MEVFSHRQSCSQECLLIKKSYYMDNIALRTLVKEESYYTDSLAIRTLLIRESFSIGLPVFGTALKCCMTELVVYLVVIMVWLVCFVDYVTYLFTT